MANQEEQKQDGPVGRGRLERIVEELERQRREKVDFVADTRSLLVRANGGLHLHAVDPRVGEWIPRAGFPIKDQALEQFGEKVEPSVPSKFIKELAAKRPHRAAELINGLMTDGPARRFVRVLDNRVRAFLSEKFRVIDNYDMAFASLDAVRDAGGEVIEASLSDTHMRLKFTTRALWDQVNVTSREGGHKWYGAGANPETLQALDASAFRGNDLPGGLGTVHPLVTVSNSETGHGGFNVSIGLFVGWCTNSAIIDRAVRTVHVGERMEVGIFSDATLRQESKAIFMKARDAVRSAFDPEGFKRIIALVKKSDQIEIKSPTAAVENVAKQVSMSDEAREALLSHFVRDYRPTNFGLAQAVSRLAQDVKDTEKAFDLEAEAGRIMKLAAAVA